MRTLETERLILRPFEMGDAQAVFDNYASDERVAKYCSWSKHFNIETTIQYLRLTLGDEFSWAIVPKDDPLDRPIGRIDVVEIDENKIPEVGYVLGFNYWGHGIMTEALKAVIDELFEAGFDKVKAEHIKENIGSGKVMAKAGMKYKGDDILKLKDRLWVICKYEIDKEEYKNADTR